MVFYEKPAKGQLISKTIYGLLTSPKKWTDEFVFFAFLFFTTNISNLSVHFLGESMARQSAFRINWPLVTACGLVNILQKQFFVLLHKSIRFSVIIQFNDSFCRDEKCHWIDIAQPYHHRMKVNGLF